MTIYIYVYIIYHVSIVSTCIYSIYRFWVVLSDDAGGTGKKTRPCSVAEFHMRTGHEKVVG